MARRKSGKSVLRVPWEATEANENTRLCDAVFLVMLNLTTVQREYGNIFLMDKESSGIIRGQWSLSVEIWVKKVKQKSEPVLSYLSIAPSTAVCDHKVHKGNFPSILPSNRSKKFPSNFFLSKHSSKLTHSSKTYPLFHYAYIMAHNFPFIKIPKFNTISLPNVLSFKENPRDILSAILLL